MTEHDISEEQVARDERVLAGVAERAFERMPAASRRAVRRAVLARAGGQPLRVQRLVLARAATACAITVSLLGGVSAAAAASLPGDALYGLKRGAEDVTVEVLSSAGLEGGFLFTLAARRGAEADRLLDSGADKATVADALGEFRAAIARAYSAQGTGTLTRSMTAERSRLAERVSAMAADVKAGYDAALRQRGTGQGGSGDTTSTPVPGGTPGQTTPNPGSGGSGSTTGSSPSSTSGPGSGTSSGSGASGGMVAPDAPHGSVESSGSGGNHRKP